MDYDHTTGMPLPDQPTKRVECDSEGRGVYYNGPGALYAANTTKMGTKFMAPQSKEASPSFTIDARWFAYYAPSFGIPIAPELVHNQPIIKPQL